MGGCIKMVTHLFFLFGNILSNGTAHLGVGEIGQDVSSPAVEFVGSRDNWSGALASCGKMF